MTYVLQMGAQYGEQRIIYDETGQVVDIIEPISAENVNIIEQPVIRTRDSHIHKRQYSRRVDELYARAEFRRYGRDSEPQKSFERCDCIDESCTNREGVSVGSLSDS